MEYEDVPYDADVVMRVLDDHDIPVKRLAMHLSLHKATVHKYLSGILTIPSSMLRGVFELTGGDLRILGLITGTIPMTIQHINRPGCSNAEPARIPPIAEWLPKTCEAVEQTAKATPYMGKILADGRVDAGDAQAIENFKRHAAEAMRCLGIMVAALEAHARKAEA